MTEVVAYDWIRFIVAILRDSVPNTVNNGSNPPSGDVSPRSLSDFLVDLNELADRLADTLRIESHLSKDDHF